MFIQVRVQSREFSTHKAHAKDLKKLWSLIRHLIVCWMINPAAQKEKLIGRSLSITVLESSRIKKK